MNRTQEVVRRVGQESTSVAETMALAIRELGVELAHDIAVEIFSALEELGVDAPQIDMAEVIEELTSHGATTRETIEGAIALAKSSRVEVVAEVRRQLAEWDDNSLEWWLVEEEYGSQIDEVCMELADFVDSYDEPEDKAGQAWELRPIQFDDMVTEICQILGVDEELADVQSDITDRMVEAYTVEDDEE